MSGQEPGLPLSTALPMQQPLCSTPLQQQQQGRTHARPAGVPEGQKVVEACCAVGRGAPTRQLC
eukprot:563752-Pelagomonas_calceolata.AAC.3